MRDASNNLVVTKTWGAECDAVRDHHINMPNRAVTSQLELATVQVGLIAETVGDGSVALRWGRRKRLAPSALPTRASVGACTHTLLLCTALQAGRLGVDSGWTRSKANARVGLLSCCPLWAATVC